MLVHETGKAANQGAYFLLDGLIAFMRKPALILLWIAVIVVFFLLLRLQH
jgi:hypothetical protein